MHDLKLSKQNQVVATRAIMLVYHYDVLAYTGSKSTPYPWRSCYSNMNGI